MMHIEGYRSKEMISEAGKSIVWRARRNSDGLPVVIKYPNTEHPPPRLVTRYKREYEILGSLHLETVVKVYDLVPYRNSLALVLEDFQAVSLRSCLAGGPPSLEKSLELGMKISRALSDIHTAGIIHKDINPSNIAVNPVTGRLKLIDFGLATRFESEMGPQDVPGLLVGQLAYISPEQTGRVNLPLDYRSDIYSLGATLYELLCGRPPFETTDPLELIHAHIARPPEPPGGDVPPVVSDMVLKLLAKNPRDRYRAARGLEADLSECLDRLRGQGKIETFVLRDRTAIPYFQMSSRLYGRAAESGRLTGLFEKAAEGRNLTVLVAGYSGIGKTTLVKELYKPVTLRRGFFISGKYEQFQTTPYSALAAAFGELSRAVLSLNQAELTRWRERLLDALGPNGRVITNLIPEMERIVGPQPPIPGLGPMEARNRFNLTFQNFIEAVCRPDRPLVLFLDDLQWADPASLNLIELMARDEDLKYFLLVGAYRDNEVDDAHPLSSTINRMEKAAESIALGPLGREDVVRITADAMQTDNHDVSRLGELVFGKTAGNPFFVNQFLKTLYDEKQIAYDADRGRWTWDLKKIKALDHTENMAELMTAGLAGLPERQRQALKMAACIGDSFDINILSIVLEQPLDRTFNDVFSGVSQGLVLPTSEWESMNPDDPLSALAIFHFRFSHDRVRQTAYDLIEEKEKPAVHLHIGRLLLKEKGPEGGSDHLFKITDHLNQGRSLITNEAEKIELAGLNLEAGRKTKTALAYSDASRYLNTAALCLPDDAWNNHYRITMDIHRTLAEALLLDAEFERAEHHTIECIHRTETDLEKAELHALRASQKIAVGEFEDAVRLSIIGMRFLDFHWPENDLDSAIAAQEAEFRQSMGHRPVESLIDLHRVTSKRIDVLVGLVGKVGQIGYSIDKRLQTLAIMITLNHTVNHGLCADSAPAFACYAYHLAMQGQGDKKAHEFIRLAYQLSQKPEYKQYHAAVCGFAVFVNPFFDSLSKGHTYTREGALMGFQTGDIYDAEVCIVLGIINDFLQGKNLLKIMGDIMEGVRICRKATTWYGNRVLNLINLVIGNLLGKSSDMFTFASDTMDEAKLLDGINRGDLMENLITSIYFVMKAHVLLVYSRPAMALECLSGFKSTGEHFQISHNMIMANITTSLSMLALIRDTDAETQKIYRSTIEANQNQMKAWVDNCPRNFLDKYLLVEAESARVDGRDIQAIDLYDQAIAHAGEQGFIHYAGLGNELAGRFWLARGKDRIAGLYLTEARFRYRHWGAKPKVEDMDETYPHLLAPARIREFPQVPTSPIEFSTSRILADSLALASVLKAAQVISKEIVLEKLLIRLMEVVLENGGAQRGCLILPQKDQWTIRVTGVVDKEERPQVVSIDFESYDRIPQTVVRYAIRTGERVVLGDAVSENRFTSDPYITQNRIKSLLCLPISLQAGKAGFLYLENASLPGVFTEDKIEVLQILAAQAAISLENARLYKELKEANAALKFLMDQKDSVKKEQERNILDTLRHTVFPFMDKMKSSNLSPVQKSYLEIVESQMKDVASSLTPRMLSPELGLTPVEVEVAELIKQGKSSLEIGELLHISEYTVNRHRSRIRKKLGLKTRRVNLAQYLRSL